MIEKIEKSMAVVLVLPAVIASVIVTIVCCIACCFVIFTVVAPMMPGKCDFEGALMDDKEHEKLSAALSAFEHEHNLNFNHDWTGWPSCTIEGYEVRLRYETSPHHSKYGIIYELGMSATYSPESMLVSLQMDDQFTETEDVLNYIDSLEGVIVEFENMDQVDEFASNFEQEGIEVIGSVYKDTLRIETHPSLKFSGRHPNISADISYSMPTRSITFYSLPNRITWHEFPLVPVFHEIVNEYLLVDDLSDCSISMNRQAYANTDVYFIPEAPSVRADVKITCDDREDDGYLRVILHPDGSHESEDVKWRKLDTK